MGDDKSVQDAPIVSHDGVRDALRLELDVAINIQRRFTAEQVAQRSGVNVHTIRSYMRNDGRKEPCASRALSVAYALGPRAVNALLHLIRYQASPLEEAGALQPMQIVSGALSHLAVIGQAAADNRIDHTEWPATMAAADELILVVTPLSSAGRAA